MPGHAYLITAYKNSYVLDRLLALLDDERNHVYLHVDKKARDFDFQRVRAQCRRADVTIVPRIRVLWAGYSQLESDLSLLRYATRGRHRYYHLLSGADLPLKSQDHIHDFFRRHDGEEFVGFEWPFDVDFVRYVHPTMLFGRSSHAAVHRAAHGFDRRAVELQRRLGYDRTAGLPMVLRKGSSWYSITHELAVRVLSEEGNLRRMLRWAFVPVEFYVQTVVWNSDLRHRVHDPHDFVGGVRYIDWSGRGAHPKVLTMADLPKLMASERLFARKFEAAVDREVIDQVHDYVAASSKTR